VLTSMYLAPIRPCGRAQRRTGRPAIVSTIKEAFTSAGVLDLIQRDLDVEKYTGPGDPLRIDFGYRIDGVLKMFHAVSVASNADQALALLYRYPRLATGMQEEKLKPLLTAVVDEASALEEEKALFAIGMLKQDSVMVRPVEEIAKIASEVRQDAVAMRLAG